MMYNMYNGHCMRALHGQSIIRVNTCLHATRITSTFNEAEMRKKPYQILSCSGAYTSIHNAPKYC